MSNQLLMRRRASCISDKETKYLKFTAQEDGSTIALNKNQNPPTYDFEFSLNGIVFAPYTIGNVITLDTNESVWFRKNGASQINTINGASRYNHYYFVATGSFECNGELTALLGWWVDGYVGTVIGNNAFLNLINGQPINAPLLIPNSVESIGTNSFEGNSLIGELDLSNIKILMSNSFAYNNISGKITIHSEITSLEYGAFSGCGNLTSLEIEYNQNLTKLPLYLFLNCSGLTGDCYIPDNFTRIEAYAFRGCVKLNGNLHLPTNLTYIGYGAFSSCPLTGPLVIPNTVTVIDSGGEVSFGAFREGHYTSLTLSNSLITVGNRAFRNCSHVQGIVDIPATVTTIGVDTFNGMTNVSAFIVRATTPPSAQTSSFTANKPIYVPYSADHSILNAYKTATNWGTYADVIYELDENGEIPE